MIAAIVALVKRGIMPLLAAANLTDAGHTHIITINPSQKVRIKKARGFPIRETSDLGATGCDKEVSAWNKDDRLKPAPYVA